jgi:two-component system response regulator AtoC
VFVGKEDRQGDVRLRQEESAAPWLQEMSHSQTTRNPGFAESKSISMSTSDHNFPHRSANGDELLGAREGTVFLGGGCPSMRSVEQVMRELALGDAPVLIRAERGAGKRTAAQRIHEMSSRSEQPFVTVDCAALTVASLSQSLSSQVRPGTVLLEEVVRLHGDCQAVLMDVLESGGVPPKAAQGRTGKQGPKRVEFAGPRFIFTTARDLEAEMAAKRFREDLYYRISGASLRLPPLRQRREEILQLIGFYLEKYAAELGRSLPRLSAEAERRLQDYAWPGNLKELQDVAKAIAVLGDANLVLGGLRGLSVLSGGRPGTRVSLKEVSKAASREAEKELILKALNKTRWNRRRAAQELQISYKALLYKLKQIGCEEFGA